MSERNITYLTNACLITCIVEMGSAEKVLEAAKNKYNFQIHLPGPGVGGPCLPVNSYQFLNTEKKLGGNILNIIRAARNTNEYMSKHVVSLLHDSLKEKNVKIEGQCFRPNRPY